MLTVRGFPRLATLVLFCMTMFSPRPVPGQCNITNYNIVAGEELRYEVAYNWGFVWIDGGEVVFRVEDGGNKLLKVTGVGKTYPSRDWIFKIRDSYITIVDSKTLMPTYAYRNNHEGSFFCEHQYHFDYGKKAVFAEVEESGKPFERDTIPLNSCSVDLMTAVCMIRNIDFKPLKENDLITINSLIGKDITPFTVRYIGKVKLSLTKSGQAFNCLKMKVNLIAGSMFKQGENMTVWVTDDENHIPVQFEAEILVGSVKAIISSIKGQKFPTR